MLEGGFTISVIQHGYHFSIYHFSFIKKKQTGCVRQFSRRLSAIVYNNINKEYIKNELILCDFVWTHSPAHPRCYPVPTTSGNKYTSCLHVCLLQTYCVSKNSLRTSSIEYQYRHKENVTHLPSKLSLCP